VYSALSGLVLGPASWGLDLTVAQWASDGLLAIFFFVVGVELKQEMLTGSLRRVRQAAVPVAAAVGGMAVPAVLFSAVQLLYGDPGALHGWAIPTATDIAFALGVLAVFGRGLPRALRAFLLTLAVMDDLIAIIVIAVFYTDRIHPVFLAVALVAVAVFGLCVRLPRLRWWLLAPVAVIAWGAMHASGVHATIAGVMLGLSVPAAMIHGEQTSRATHFDRGFRSVAIVIALPIFAFFSTGITLKDAGGFSGLATQSVFLGVAAGLVVGKLVGVLGTTAVLTRWTPLRLPDGIGLRDLLPVGFLTGIGFTVSLLVAELSFSDTDHVWAAKAGIMAASVVAGILGAVTLRWDARRATRAGMSGEVEHPPEPTA